MHELDTQRRRITELETAEAKHKQVEEELERRATLAELTHDVVLRTSGELEPNELFSTIVTAISEALDYYSVALLLVDGTLGQLTLQAVAGHMAKVIPENLQIAIGEGMVGYAAESGESQINGDIRQHPRYVRKMDSTAKSELAVPIKRGEKVVGVLDIQSESLDAFDEVAVGAMETLSTQIASSIENARLYEEALSRAERLAVVTHIAKAIGASLRLEELVETVYQQTAPIFQADTFFIAFVDEKADELDFRFVVDEGVRQRPGRSPLSATLSSVVVTEKRLLHIRDWEREKDQLPGGWLFGEGKRPRSWLGVPLVVGERVIGVLNVQAYRPNAYGEEEEKLLATIGDQIAVAIENARLFEETHGRAERLAAVNRVAKAVGASLQLDKLMEVVYREIASVFENDSLYITLYDEQAQELNFLFGVEHGERLIPERIPLGSGFTSQVVIEKKPLHIRNYEQERDHLPTPVMWGEESKIYPSWVGMPMLIGERVIGTISVMADRPYAYSDEQEALLSTIADQVAIAIENARLFEETRKRADRLALVNRISKATSAVLQLDGLMEHVYQEIAPVFQVDTFLIALYDEEAEELDFRFQVDEGVRVPPERLPLGTGVSSIVVTEKKPLITRTKEEYERLLPSGQHLFGTMKVSASWLGVPLMIGDRVIGVVSVQSYRPYAFGEEDELLLSTIADQIAIATENARLYEAISQELTDRKRKEEEIRRLGQYLESVIDNATVWLNVLDKEGNVVIWNKAAEAISGYSREEVVRQGKQWERLLYPDEAYRLEVLNQEVASRESGDSAKEVETTIRCKDGHAKTISWTSRGLLDEGGDMVGSIAIARDITDRKRAEEALRASEERFALAVAGSNEGIWDWDIQNDTLYWSPRMKEMLGYADDELDVDFDTLETLLHPDDKEHTKSAIDVHLKDRVPYDVEQRLLTKSGEYVWVHARGQAVWDEDGQPTRMVGSSTDITELKRAEEEIRKLNQFQESIIDNANVWINVLDEEANIVLWNKAAEEISGYSGEEVVGHGKIWEWLYLDEAYREEVTRKVAAILKSGKADADLETIIRCKDGQTKIISWNSKNLIDDEGTFAGSITLGQDVTKLRQAEEQIQRYISEIEAANEEIKQFAYIVSHDLRAPLVNLKGFATELRSALQDISPVIEVALPTLDDGSRHDIDVSFREDIPEALGFIESSVTRMDSFINAVLKLSRLGRRELSRTSVNMNAVVEAARQSLAHQIEECHVNLTVTDLPEVVADQTSMEQIVGNLFANALLYLDPDRPGEIDIGGKQDGSTTTFWVRDNGRGISEDDAPKVFAPFRRAGKQDVPGEGMGLSYVKTTVRMHRGHIWFESEPDVGTTFFFTIANDPAKGETDDGQTRD